MQATTATKQECHFYKYARKEDIMQQFNSGGIISGYHHPQYPQHVIVAYSQPQKTFGLLAFKADIGDDEQYQSGLNYCRFFEDERLATSTPKEHIYKNVTIGAIMLPFTKPNEQLQNLYSVIYSDWDIMRSNGDKGIPQISYDVF